MKALVFRGVKSLAVENRQEPDPVAGEAIIKVAAAGICGSDLHGYLGMTGRREPGMVMGHELSGELVGFGPGTDPEGFRIGDIVTATPLIACGACVYCETGRENICVKRRIIGVVPDRLGAYAEYISVPAQNLVGLGSNIRPEEGSLVEPLSVGMQAARIGGVKPGDSVAVIGGGPIGVGCLLGAKRLGASPIYISEPNADRRAVSVKMGAEAVDLGSDQGIERVRDETHGLGCAVVMDAVGISQTIAQALQVCAPDGKVVLVGMHDQNVNVPLYDVVTQQRHVVGTLVYTDDIFTDTAHWVASSPPEIEGVIQARIGFDEIVERFHRMAVGEEQPLKAVLVPGA